MTKKCAYITLGCKVNQYDTQAIREQLEQVEIQETKDFREADFLLINSCTVTEKADQKTRRYIQSFSKRNPQGKVILTGCSADNHFQKYAENTQIQYVFRNRDKKTIAQQITEGSAEVKPLRITRFDEHTRAFLKIQDGCQETCSFCIIPKVRGRFNSQEEDDVVEEAKALVRSGYREIVLTGIHLGGYGVDRAVSLTGLIRKLLTLPELYRLRLSSIEVNEIDEEMIHLLQNEEKFCPHLHLPLQSGDDTVLAAMRRKYTRQDFINKALDCKNRVPGLEVTTDIIVGFPGETEEQFQNTLRLCEEVHFSKIHIFPYSDRRGTRAISMENKCSRNTIKQRVKELGVLEEKLAILSMKKYEGAILSVLGEEETKEKETIGITGNYFRVRFPGIGFRNRLSLVKIHSVEGREMLGLKIANENFEIF